MAALRPQHRLELDLSAVVPHPLLQKTPTHRRWPRSRVPGPGARCHTREAPVREATQGCPQQRHVLRRSASLRDARHHRSSQLGEHPARQPNIARLRCWPYHGLHSFFKGNLSVRKRTGRACVVDWVQGFECSWGSVKNFPKPFV